MSWTKVTLTYANPLSVNMSLGNEFSLTATGATTINATGGTAGQLATFIITNDASSSRTITFGTGFKTNGPIIGIISKIASISFSYDGTNWVEIGRWKEGQANILDLPIAMVVPWSVNDGSNSCTLTLNYDSVNNRNFLRCTSSSITQNYDIRWGFKIPDTFSSFPTGALLIDCRMSDKVANIGLVTMSNSTNIADPGISGAAIGGGLTNNVWGTYTDTPTQSYTPGEYAYINIHLGNNAANDTEDIARVNLSYIQR